jgi:hypothetical protein
MSSNAIVVQNRTAILEEEDEEKEGGPADAMISMFLLHGIKCN